MKWTKEEINKSINLLKEGKTYLEISILLNRTAKSVKLKLNNFGFRSSDYSEITYYSEHNCLKCKKEFSDLKSYTRKFCSQSCAASYNNKLRQGNWVSKNKIKNEIKRRKYHTRKKNNCLSCGEITTNKFCNSNCQQKFRKDEILRRIQTGDNSLSCKHYKRYLIHIYCEKCMECGWNRRNEYSGKIPIELEHIDGNSENNSLDNLKLLCPNCHSLTPTYKALNTGNGRHKRRERYKQGKSF